MTYPCICDTKDAGVRCNSYYNVTGIYDLPLVPHYMRGYTSWKLLAREMDSEGWGDLSPQTKRPFRPVYDLPRVETAGEPFEYRLQSSYEELGDSVYYKK